MPHMLRMVAVGVDQYKYYPDAKLNFASRDATEIARAFRECTDLSLEIGSPHILTNTEATYRNIRTSMRDTFRSRSSDSRSTAIFYFAGHGIVTEEPPRTYLCCHDFNIIENDVDRGIPIEEVYELLSDSSAECAIAIIDACFSGSLLIEPIDPKMAAKIAYKNMQLIRHPGGKTIALYVSCRSDQQSRESWQLGHGLYTYCILQGLRACLAADRDGHITLQGLFEYVDKQFRGDEQKPQLSIRGGEPLILKTGVSFPPSSLPQPVPNPGISSQQVLPPPEFPPVSGGAIGWREKVKDMRSLLLVLLIIIMLCLCFFLFTTLTANIHGR